MGLIFYLSSLPGESQKLNSIEIFSLGELRDYAAHLLLYGVLASLIQASLWGWISGYRLQWALIAASVASLYGVSDEYHQSFVIGR